MSIDSEVFDPWGSKNRGFPLTRRVTLTTVLHYRADCDSIVYSVFMFTETNGVEDLLPTTPTAEWDSVRASGRLHHILTTYSLKDARRESISIISKWVSKYKDIHFYAAINTNHATLLSTFYLYCFIHIRLFQYLKLLRYKGKYCTSFANYHARKMPIMSRCCRNRYINIKTFYRYFLHIQASLLTIRPFLRE